MQPSTPDGRSQRQTTGSAHFLLFGLISVGAVVGLAAIGLFFGVFRSTAPAQVAAAPSAKPNHSTPAQLVSTTVSTNKGVGTLIGGKDCEWGPSEMPTEQHTRLVPGKIALTKGVAEIRLDQGAVLILEGPAVFEIRTKNSAMLHRGKLVAHVPQRAKGFRLETTSATIIDLGLDAEGGETPGINIVPHDAPLDEEDLFGPDAPEAAPAEEAAPADEEQEDSGVKQLKAGESLEIPAPAPTRDSI